MPADDGGTTPKVGDLIRQVLALLQDFDPTTLTYLSAGGSWQTEPTHLRDRISNELWFRVWQASAGAGFDREIGSLFRPVIENPYHWDYANRAFSAMIAEAPAGRTDLLIATELLYRLIEYDALKTDSEAYVADWDSVGRRRRSEFARRKDNLLGMLALLPGCDERAETFLAIHSHAKALQPRVFRQVCGVIAEEERLRREIRALVRGSISSGATSLAYDVMEQPSLAALSRSTAEAEALLRPSIELLGDSEIDISSGMRFEAAELLGRLSDIRSLAALLTALKDLDYQYTHLRSIVAFAVGNLSHERSLSQLIQILEEPDYATARSFATSPKRRHPTFPEKLEAIWALGKLGSRAVGAVPVLKRYSDSTDREMGIYLAWAMGRIGKGQKEDRGGVDVDVITTLMSLLASRDSAVFEEAAFALREIGLPDFLHALYLHDFAKIPILSLKPSRVGLYELSETLLHLISLKQPVVMAVTGDSGTGKTYFCQTIAAGFGGIMPNEIVYLMRDRIGDKRLDMMLGIRWLRAHVAPRFYQDYPVSEDQDDPDAFFEAFMSGHAGKKLIILDGWRDEVYFNEIVETFYDKGYLDLLVRFDTTFSTRRINLEERERSLDGVKDHLPLVEEPAIEETGIYREGEVLIYNLDNSIQSRLDRTEVREVFERKKVDTWGDQVRIGRFVRDTTSLPVKDTTMSSEEMRFNPATEVFNPYTIGSFRSAESGFKRVLNEHIEESPNLLETIEVAAIPITRISFYNQGQIACCGYDGTIGILAGFNDRVFSTQVHDAEVVNMSVLGRSVCSIDTEGKLRITSFHTNTISELASGGVPAGAIISDRSGVIATGHSDGTVRLWDRRAKQVTVLKGHRGAVFALAMDRLGRVYSAGQDMELRIWNPMEGTVRVLAGHRYPIRAMGLYADGRLVTGSSCDNCGPEVDQTSGIEIRLIDVSNHRCETFELRRASMLKAMTVYFDGRIFLAMSGQYGTSSSGNMAVVDPRPGFRQYSILAGHAIETRSCVTMGPRIISCGSESGGNYTIKIWGTASYIGVEHNKQRLLPQGTVKPPYYRSLF